MPKRKKPHHPPLPAPGRLRIVQRLINTRKIETETDELTSPEALSAWLAHREVLPANAEIDDKVWRDTLAIREALRAMIDTHTGGALAEGTVERLRDAFGEFRPRLDFAPGGKLRLENVDDGWPGFLGELMMIVFEAMNAGVWTRLKACHNDHCRLVFYDAARNRLGKWCNVRRCGVRANSKIYRRRGRAGTRTRLGWRF